MKEPGKAKYRFIPDIAIEKGEQDRLGHSFYVDQIVSMIFGCDPKYPFNIGLFGKWGSGKTGIINLLKDRIETDVRLKKQVDFAYIDVWKFSKESLRQEILVELNRKFGQMSPDEIQERLYYVREEETEAPVGEPRRRRLERISRSVAPYLALFAGLALTGIFLSRYLNVDMVAPLVVLVLIPLFFQMLDRVDAAASAVRRSSKLIIPQASSPQEFESLFRKTISGKESQKLVLAVDNLDRCDSEVAVEMLGTIKSMMEIPGCIYLIACDNEALERHLENTKRFEELDAKEFLRKFFQTSITIPSLIDEEFGKYVDDVVAQLDIEFSEPVKEVLMAAATRNPRRVKQFLNTLIPAYGIALSREEKGILTKGAVTSNMGFLAKIIVLRDEWPKFYDELERNEDLIANFERYFMGEVKEPPLGKVPTELVTFLRATRTITAEDLGPFLRLSQESYESTISELSAFRNRLLNGEVEYVSAILENLDEERRVAYIKEILKLIDSTSKQGKFSQLFNCLFVSTKILSLIPPAVKSASIRSLEIHLFRTEILTNLRKLDARKVFELLPEMTRRSREQLIAQYADLLFVEKKFDNELFELFLDNRRSLGPLGVELLNDALISLLEADEVAFNTRVEKILVDTTLARDLVSQRLISRVIARIDAAKGVPENTPRVAFYFRVKTIVSDNNKIQFVRALLKIMTHKETTSFEPNIEFSLSRLMALDVNEIPDAVKGECFAAIMKFAGLMSDPIHKVAFYKFMLRHYNRLDSKDSETLAVSHLKPILDSGPANAIQELIKSAQEFEAPILNSAAIVSSLATRIKSNLPDQSLIEYLIEKSPPQFKGQAISLIVGLIQSNDPGRFAPALKATVTKRASLPREGLDEVCVASVDGVRRLGISQASTFLDTVLTMLPDTSDVASKVLTDLLVENLKSDDPNARNIGANYYRKIRDDIADERRGEIAHQLILKLQSMSEKLDHATTVIDLVLEDQRVLEEQYMNQFIDLLLAQLSTARPVNVQLLGINSLARMKELGRRADRTLEEILALAKASPQVRGACKQALDSMRKFKGSKGFWKQVEELQ